MPGEQLFGGADVDAAYTQYPKECEIVVWHVSSLIYRDNPFRTLSALDKANAGS